LRKTQKGELKMNEKRVLVVATVVLVVTVVVGVVSFWGIIQKGNAILELQEDNLNTLDRISRISSSINSNLGEITKKLQNQGMSDKKASSGALVLAFARAFEGDVEGADAWLEDYRFFCLRAGIEVDETKIKQVKEIAQKYPLVQPQKAVIE